MLIPPKLLSRLFNVRPSGVLHVGAHLAEEEPLYRTEGWGRIIWVEAQGSLVKRLRKRLSDSNNIIVQAAAWSESTDLTLNVANNGQSSSLFQPQLHEKYYPSVEFNHLERIHAVALETVLPRSEFFDFVNLDIQGAELKALEGLGERLADVRWIYSEVNAAELYSGIPLVGEIDQFLEVRGFQRVATRWSKAKWGDALYVRPSSIADAVSLTIRKYLFATFEAGRIFVRKCIQGTRRLQRRLTRSLLRGT